MSASTILLLTIFIPLAGAALIGQCDRRPNVREAVTLITAGLLFLAVVFGVNGALLFPLPFITRDEFVGKP